MGLLTLFLKAYSAFTDVLLAVVPIFAFWKLQMKLRDKIGVCLLMGMTALCVVVSNPGVFDSKLLQCRNMCDHQNIEAQ